MFFRLFLLIPHAIFLWLYGIGAGIVGIIAWFAALFTGRVPDGLHDFIVSFNGQVDLAGLLVVVVGEGEDQGAVPLRHTADIPRPVAGGDAH